jgi:hypothetical protein
LLKTSALKPSDHIRLAKSPPHGDLNIGASFAPSDGLDGRLVVYSPETAGGRKKQTFPRPGVVSHDRVLGYVAQDHQEHHQHPGPVATLTAVD